VAKIVPKTRYKTLNEIIPFQPMNVNDVETYFLEYHTTIFFITAPAEKIFRRVVFEEIFKLALCSVNSATCQFTHFRQTARFLEKFNCQGSIIR